jgi:hypothetical protein
VDICPSRIAILLSFIKRFSLVSTFYLTLYLKNSMTYFKRFLMLILQRDIDYRRFTVMNGASEMKESLLTAE